MFGGQYRRYREQVSMLVPWPGLKLSNDGAVERASTRVTSWTWVRRSSFRPVHTENLVRAGMSSEIR
jgi:hypothetical protein